MAIGVCHTPRAEVGSMVYWIDEHTLRLPQSHRGYGEHVEFRSGDCLHFRYSPATRLLQLRLQLPYSSVERLYEKTLPVEFSSAVYVFAALQGIGEALEFAGSDLP
jgi:hypothetical protein